MIDPEALAIHEAALKVLADAGASIREIPLPVEFEDVHRLHRVVLAAEAASVHSPRMDRHPEIYPPRIRTLVEEGRAVFALDYIRALDTRQSLKEAIDRAIAGVHALVVPAALGPAPGVETTGDPSFNSPWNFAQLPTVSFPVGLSVDGLPLGMQVVGHRYQQPFEVARWCEQFIRQSRQRVDRNESHDHH